MSTFMLSSVEESGRGDVESNANSKSRSSSSSTRFSILGSTERRAASEDGATEVNINNVVVRVDESAVVII